MTSTSYNETFGMVGSDSKLRRIIETIRTAAPSDASVLIEGESGTGKQLIAAAIHAQSHRRSGPFVRVDCGGIPPEQFEAELCGYRNHVSNGADRDKRGFLEAANGGTLLLDEIAEMPAHLQAKLFRHLQERKLRLASELEIDLNFRLVATTSHNTTALLQQGVLRNDLYFRISTIKIKVPALRERLDDIPVIAEHFLNHFNTKYNKKIRGFSEETMSRLERYDWPGNIRELESVIERAVLFCPVDELQPECLPEQFQTAHSSKVAFVIPPLVPMEEIEREAILQTLARTSGNVKRSAQILHYPRPTFYRRLKKFGIKVERDSPRTQLDRVQQ